MFLEWCQMSIKKLSHSLPYDIMLQEFFQNRNTLCLIIGAVVCILLCLCVGEMFVHVSITPADDYLHTHAVQVQGMYLNFMIATLTGIFTEIALFNMHIVLVT